MDKKEFLRRRKTGIGGSDVAAVLGLSQFKTPYEVWLDKTTDAINTGETEAQHWGHIHEAAIARDFARRHGLKVQRRNKLFRHPDHPELIADIDRYIVGGSILECKTCSEWARGKFTDEKDGIPEAYYLQVQHYMLVTGYRDCWLAVLIGGNEYHDYHISFDAPIAVNAARKCLAFWHDFVVTNTPPPASLRDDLAQYYKATGATITADQQLYDLAMAVKAKRLACDNAKKDLEKWEFTLKSQLQGNENLLSPDGELFLTWKQGSDRRVTDWQAVAVELGAGEEVIEKHTMRRPGIRPLRFVEKKTKKE